VLGITLLLGVVLGASACTGNDPSHTPHAKHAVQPSASTSRDNGKVDRWGVQKLYPDRPGGQAWYANWRTMKSDDWVKWIDTGSSHVVDPTTETLKVGGDTVRMYVLNPNHRSQWTGGLEITVYAERLPNGRADRGVPYSGIVTDARTNHGSVGNVHIDPCDSRGMSARLRFDGTTDFGKEIRHPRTVSLDDVQVWDGGMPVGQWIGYKQIIYDNDQGVVQELWVDFPGHTGQKWVRVNQHVDKGGWGTGERPCAKGIDPTMLLQGGTDRVGSESGLPNIAVLFRADGLDPSGGLAYRYASVREVVAP